MIIPDIPTYKEILDKAFSRARKSGEKLRTLRIPRNVKYRRIEETKIQTACDVMISTLKRILDKTPIIDELPEFYQDYIDVTVGIDELKKSLGAINRAIKIISQLKREYTKRIKFSSPKEAYKLRREIYGRISSVIKEIKDDLDFLDFAKNRLKNMPTIDFDAVTVVIAGYPNVGKSTLLRKLTGANPEVAEYPFTTKGIQIGYRKIGWGKLQVVDTPGLLDRPVDKMNEIELQALVALENLADLMIFIFDPSETCGYPLEKQFALYKNLRKVFNVPIISVFNKIDLVENLKYLKKYINKVENPILVSATEGKGLKKLIAKLEELYERLERKIWKT
ncbi:small GTP-binding protein [Methanothermus fervidus DSM 2088]|uniref:Small GTP-binding protein n=1 Tax=Methanothermus fervidus (strain ATCC 43054 / DSM 2088 / JCM 10308 / V24 S) TaxID=523846 RepID=E3GX55_METFV|nr:NOG1 family protein [Methanothermus fervidus]ADP78050.1 small GTP-binding protein [Methanothermus fervidus DSM 2088]